jgi:hypothetical protein
MTAEGDAIATNARRAHLAAASEHLKAQIDALTEQREQVTAELRDLGGGPAGTRADGTPRVVQVETATRFDPALAATLLPAEQVAALTEPVVSATKARALLPPAAYAACCAPYGKPRVTVR